MAYGNNQRVHIFYSTHILQLYSIETLRLCAVCGLIHQHRLDAVLTQLFYNIDNLCISGIRAVLLEGKAKDRNLRMLYRDICANQVFTMFSATYLPMSSLMRRPDRMIWE